jgi:hypothetical protein
MRSPGLAGPRLHPAIGAFDLAFGLGRESVNHLHPEDLHRAFPLRICLVGLQPALGVRARGNLHGEEVSEEEHTAVVIDRK